MCTDITADALAHKLIMLVDDSQENLTLLERMFDWAGYSNVRSFRNATVALDELAACDPHLIILDLNMPGMDGYEFMSRLRDDHPDRHFMPILVFTADLTQDAKIRALEMGASDFLTKPGDASEIRLRVKNFLKMRQLQSDLESHNLLLEAKVEMRTELLETARREAVDLLATACEFRDDETGQHTRRVGEMSACIAEVMNLGAEFVESLRIVAPLHDIGKIAVPDHILRKPGPLSDEEFSLMKCHVGIGANMLAERSSPLIKLAAEIARYHHERWDGTGYQAGLAGEEIPISARIVTVADTFDAITNDRPYRKGRSFEEALAEINRMSGKQFDPSIVRALETHLSTCSDFSRIAA